MLNTDHSQPQPHRRGRIGRSLDERIGREIRTLRRKRGLTLMELAAISGLTMQQVQRCEVGLARLSVASLVCLAEALSVPASYFLLVAEEAAAAE